MKISRPSRKLPIVPVASIADIAFLLIIFFILTSNFMKEKDIAAEMSQSIDVEKLEHAPVSVVVDEDGQVWLDGEVCDVAALEVSMGDRLEGETQKLVMVKVDKGQPHSAFSEVMLALSRAEVEIALVGEKRKK